MKNRLYRTLAAMLCATLIVTGTPGRVYALEADNDVLESVSAGTILSEDEVMQEDALPELFVPEQLTDIEEPLLSVNSLNEGEGSSVTEAEGEVPEEYLNYHDINDYVEESEIGFDEPVPSNTFFVKNDRASSLPASFIPAADKRPAVRDQRPFGACWSFASMAVCEFSLIKNYGLKAVDMDLAERALIYFFYNLGGINDPLGNTLSDNMIPKMGSDPNIYQLGGNTMLASFFLANWGMPFEEVKAPYAELATISADKLSRTGYKGEDALDASLCYDPSYHVQNVRFINADDRDGIKRAIQNNGSIARSYYNNSTYYNSANYAYNSGSRYKSTNHAITVIGWDDNFSRDNFNSNCKPDNNGAWLVRNSWGASYGNDGYMWISYEDKSLNTAVVMYCEPKDNYDNNYFYDGSCDIKGMGYTGRWEAANIYTAQGNEMLKAVSIGMKSADVPYSVQVYTNLTDPADPTSGKAMLVNPVEGTTSYPGLYTIPLGTEIPIKAGQTFSVVFTLSTDGSEKTNAYVEKSSDEYDWITIEAQINVGQSFGRRFGQTGWYDLAGSGACFRIHAFTKNDSPKYYYVVHDGYTESKTPVSDLTSIPVLYKDEGYRYYIEDATSGKDISGVSSSTDIFKVSTPHTEGGVRRFELIPKGEGLADLTIRLNANTEYEDHLELRVYQPSISLSKTVLEFNSAMDTRKDSLDIFSGYHRKIKSVTVEGADGFTSEYKGNISDTSGTLNMEYTGPSDVKSYTATLKIELPLIDPIYRQVKLVVLNAKPTMTSSQTKKVDTLYVPDVGKGSINIRVENGIISDIRLVDAGLNGMTKKVPNPLSYRAESPMIAADGLSADLPVKLTSADANPKYRKGRLEVYLEGYTNPVVKNVSIGYIGSLLKPSLTATSFLTQKGAVLAGNDAVFNIVNKKTGAVEAFVNPGFIITDNKGRSLADRYSIVYDGSGFILKPVTGMALASKGETIQISINDDTHAGAFTIPRFKIGSVDTGKMVLVTDPKSVIAHFYEDDTAINSGLTYSAGLKIKGCQGMNDYIGERLVIEGMNKKSTDVLASGRLNVSYSSPTGLVTVAYPGGNPPAAGSYKFRLKIPASASGPKKTVATVLTVNVRKLDKVRARSCKVVKTGTFDVLNRDGIVNFKPVFSNLPSGYTVAGVRLTGLDSDKFFLDGYDERTGIARVTLTGSGSYSTKDKFSLGFEYTLNVGGGTLVTVADSARISVKQGKLTLKASGVDVFNSYRPQSETVDFKAYNSLGEEIAVDKAALINPNADFSLVEPEPGKYAIKYTPNGAVKKGGSYELKFKVNVKDKATDTDGSLVTYKVSVAQ